MAGQVHSDRGVEGPVGFDLSVADLDVDRVNEHRGVNLLQRPRNSAISVKPQTLCYNESSFRLMRFE